PGLVKALAHDLGFDQAALQRDLAAVPPPEICNLQFAICNLQLPFPALRTCGDVLEVLGLLARYLVQECWRLQSDEAALASFAESCNLQLATCKLQIAETLGFLWQTVWP